MKTYLKSIDPKLTILIYILIFILPNIYDTYNYFLNDNINLFKGFTLIYLLPLIIIPFFFKFERSERNIFILQCFSISLGTFYTFKYLIIFRLVSSIMLSINLFVLFLIFRYYKLVKPEIGIIQKRKIFLFFIILVITILLSFLAGFIIFTLLTYYSQN